MSTSWKVRRLLPLSPDYRAPADDENNFAGINDALVGRLTDSLPEEYLQGLKELYINFHGPSLVLLVLPPDERG